MLMSIVPNGLDARRVIRLQLLLFLVTTFLRPHMLEASSRAPFKDAEHPSLNGVQEIRSSELQQTIHHPNKRLEASSGKLDSEEFSGPVDHEEEQSTVQKCPTKKHVVCSNCLFGTKAAALLLEVVSSRSLSEPETPSDPTPGASPGIGDVFVSEIDKDNLMQGSTQIIA